MELTGRQREMLSGRHGKGAALALEVLVAVGECFDATRLVPITRAHVSLSAQDADVWFAEKLAAAGGRCAVPTTVNPGYSLRCFGETAADPGDNMRRAHAAYSELGAVMSYSCTPYLFDNIPRFGEVTAFSETSATIYVNAVLGARTNREGANSALCAAIAGYVPEYGMLLPENRLADTLVEVDAPLESDFDYSLLGLMGKKIGGGVPVFTGLPPQISTEALINLGTQLNVTGSYAMFHIPGVTPEARDLDAALGGRTPKRHVKITEEDLLAARDHEPADPVPDFVMLGCPHYTFSQVRQVLALLAGRRASLPIWVLTSAPVRSLAEEMGILARLEAAGCTLIEGTCVDQPACWGELRGKTGLTDSPKCAYYTATFGVRMVTRDTAACLAAAVEGRGGDGAL